MRATFRRYSRSWIVHAIILVVAVIVGLAIALFARPTRGVSSARHMAFVPCAPPRTLKRSEQWNTKLSVAHQIAVAHPVDRSGNFSG